MAQQTINVGTAPNDGTGTPLRTAFQYTNSNFSELYTAVGPSGNNIVVPGSATITGDLTVDTSTLKVDSANNAVGVGTASPTANTLTIGANRFIICSDSQSKFGDNGLINGAAADGNTQIQFFGSKSLFFNEGVATRMTLNSTGLGVGGSPTAKISCAGYSSANQLPDINIARSSSGTAIQTGPNIVFTDGTSNNTITLQNSQGRFGIWNYGAGAWNERLSVDAAGNVGIGVTPSAWSAGFKVIQIGSGPSISTNGNASRCDISTNYYYNGGNKFLTASGFATAISQENGNFYFQRSTTTSGGIGSSLTFDAPMILDASGRLLVNTASVIGGSGDTLQIAGKTTAGTDYCSMYTGTSTTVYGARYYHTSAVVGSITFTALGTAYNIASDYRLKEAVAPLTGGLARVSALKPSIYKWKVNGSDGEGFIAHELAEVIPAAVTGQKDAVNEDGSIQPQQVDLSKIVPVLVAAIQELTARVQTLETR